MRFVNGVSLTGGCENCCPHWQCVMQSEEIPLVTTGETSNQEHETTQFMDEAQGVQVGSPAETTNFDISDAVIDAGLTQFLSRPVRIASFTWNESDAISTTITISPWNAFFNNANIKYKLNNFAFLRANLKVKVVVNASPFYYGSMRACYQPLPAFKQTTVVSGTSGSQLNSELIPYSQQPGVWIKPQHSEGAEMMLPFFWPKSFVRAQVAQDFTDLGTLRLVVFNTLRSANGVTGTGVTVQVYAWAEDVYLAGPSVGLAMQADEYGTGPVSGPASTVASIASKLTGIPVIGKFAVATEMGARAVSGIAKLFGWTNVPVIEPALPYRPSPFPQFASPEIGYPTEKLTLDSKNELSVDPSVLGLPPQDELSVQSFATRPSFLVSANWSTTTPVDTPLFTTKVTPSCVPNSVVLTNGSLNQFTPLSYISQLFSAWRGDIIFTFRFIASPFHKGRVRISYDPFNASIQTTADTGAVVYNKIVDLAAETEVDILVPYQQALAWCNTSTSGLNYTTSASPTISYTEASDNGILSVKVLTALSAPVASSDIDIQVFIRGADNIEFANPKRVTSFSPFAMQALEYSEPVTGATAALGANSADLDTVRNRVYMGEQVRSLRPLLRRTNFIDAIVPQSNTTNLGVYYVKQRRFPLPWGYDPNGWNTAKGVTATTTTFAINFVQTTPYHLISNCFLAQKGAGHWHFNWQGPTTQTLRMTRYPATGGVSKGYLLGTVGSDSAMTQSLVNNVHTSAAGTAVVNQMTNAGLSTSLPNYTVFKFQTTDPNKSAVGTALDGSDQETFYLTIDNNGAVDDLNKGRLERYFGVGTDYSLYFFLNCPSLYYYAPTAMVAV